MVQFIPPRIRILLVIIGAFFLSSILMGYSVGETETVAPQIHMQSIASDLADSIAESKASILASISSIQLPTFTSGTTPVEEEPTPLPTVQEQPTMGWGEIVPTSPPTSTPYQAPSPTSAKRVTQTPQRYPTIRQASPTPFVRPTTPPPPTAKPTAIPKPTKPPKPTPYPAITTDERPGSSVQEIAREVGKRACFPYALLMATSVKESGPWLGKLNSSTAKKLNTYGWWKAASKSEVCSYLGYYTQSGLIPLDSGGGSCNGGVQPGAYDQKIMGLMQVSEEEETRTRKYTQTTLPNSIDRRVLFDNALIYAMATKNRLGVTPQGCDDWPQDIIKLAAEKHFGACQYPGGNYCTEILNLYNSFK